MESNLIEIKREQTGFFTSIFVYDNSKTVPMEVVEVGDVYKNDNMYSFTEEKKYTIFFKDLETEELLCFTADCDGELINGDTLKTNNYYLIERMEDFVRLQAYLSNPFVRYYKKEITLEDLIEDIKVDRRAFTDSKKLLCYRTYLTEENYILKDIERKMIETNKYVARPKNIRELTNYFIPGHKVFSEVLCKCILWYSNQEQLKYWKRYLFKVLVGLGYYIIDTKEFDGKERLCLDKFFNKAINENYIKSELNNTLSEMTNYCLNDYKKFGSPNIVDCKRALKVYKDFKKEFYDVVLYCKKQEEIHNDSCDIGDLTEELLGKYLELASKFCISKKMDKVVRN